MLRKFNVALMGMVLVILVGCRPDHPSGTVTPLPDADPYPDFTAAFGDEIDLDNLPNYENQDIPPYILRDNSDGKVITNPGAVLGRVLFYDKNLSSDNSTSCASCHIQEFAFSDPALLSQGANGITGRHAMRLVNARFADEVQFFWDERAATLEEQTTMPIQDHAEMGFSGTNGDPNFDDLINKLWAIGYYRDLFTFVYGTSEITEEKMQDAMAQFIRSMQSFDSKYDVGRANAPNDGPPFPNFTMQENQGKNLFLAPPQFAPGTAQRVGGGAGCAGCHQPPEFAIAPNSRNNGVVGVATDPNGIDVSITRSPSIRDVAHTNGQENGPFMHDGSLTTLMDVVNHYNSIQQIPGNNNLDPRLRPAGQPQQLNLTQQEKDALVAFMITLSGTNVYTDERWSDPFN